MSIWASLPGNIRASERHQATTDEYAGTGEREILVDVAIGAGTVRLGFFRSTPGDDGGEPCGEDWNRAEMILQRSDLIDLIATLIEANSRIAARTYCDGGAA
jgi:hypothetical protein